MLAFINTFPLQSQPCYVAMHVCKHWYEFQSCGVLGTGWEIDLMSTFTHLLSELFTKLSAVAFINTSPLQTQPCYVGMHVCKHSYEFQSCGVLGTGWEIDLTSTFTHLLSELFTKSSAVAFINASPLQKQPCYVAIHVYSFETHR